MVPGDRLNITYAELESAIRDMLSLKTSDVVLERVEMISLQNSCHPEPLRPKDLVRGLREVPLSELGAGDWFALVKETSNFIDRLVAVVPVEVERA